MKHRDSRSLRGPGLAGLLILFGLLVAAPAVADEPDAHAASAEAFTPLVSLFDRQPLHAKSPGPKGLYRFLSKHFKIGLSYSRPDFAGELASIEDHRVFFNVVGML